MVNLYKTFVCGGNIGSVETELKRHRKFDYDKMFHFEVVEESIDYEKVIKDDILCPKVPIESVNLIYADVGGTSVEKTTKFKVEEVVRKGLQNNKLKTLVFLFFNGINQEPFLNDNFNIKSKDFFSENIHWYDKWNNEYYTQRLDGIVFYE